MAYKTMRIPKAFNDKNLNSMVPLEVSSSMPSDRKTSADKLASPKSPTSINTTGKKARFKRLASIIKP